MNTSRRVMNRHLGGALLLVLLSILLLIAGVLMLCVGTLFTLPIGVAMWAAFYEEICGARVRSS